MNLIDNPKRTWRPRNYGGPLHHQKKKRKKRKPISVRCYNLNGGMPHISFISDKTFLLQFIILNPLNSPMKLANIYCVKPMLQSFSSVQQFPPRPVACDLNGDKLPHVHEWILHFLLCRCEFHSTTWNGKSILIKRVYITKKMKKICLI